MRRQLIGIALFLAAALVWIVSALLDGPMPSAVAAVIGGLFGGSYVLCRPLEEEEWQEDFERALAMADRDSRTSTVAPEGEPRQRSE